MLQLDKSAQINHKSTMQYMELKTSMIQVENNTSWVSFYLLTEKRKEKEKQNQNQWDCKISKELIQITSKFYKD